MDEIRVNGQPIEAKKGYTSSDDGIITRSNIYNEWVSELARRRAFLGRRDRGRELDNRGQGGV